MEFARAAGIAFDSSKAGIGFTLYRRDQELSLESVTVCGYRTFFIHCSGASSYWASSDDCCKLRYKFCKSKRERVDCSTRKLLSDYSILRC